MNRRALLKSLAGAVGATVAPAPVLKPRSLGASTLGVDMAKDHVLDALRCYVMVQNPQTGVFGMYSYKATPENAVQITKVIAP